MSRYVAIEGVDGAGKSTVAEGVAERLRVSGHSVVVVREPGGTPVGEQIRATLLHGSDMTPWTEALLFAAQRSQLAATVVKPALLQGDLVVSDRSYYSSLAYQGGARGLGIDRVRAINETGLAGVEPDLVVVLWLDPDEALAREDGPDRISAEGREFQREVARAYRHLSEQEPDRVRLVDAARPLSEIVEDIAKMVEQ